MAAATAVARSAVASSSSCCRLSTCSGSPSVVVPVVVDVICPMQFVATALVSGRSFVVLVVLSAVAVSLCVFCCCGCGEYAVVVVVVVVVVTSALCFQPSLIQKLTHRVCKGSSPSAAASSTTSGARDGKGRLSSDPAP